MYKNSGLDLSIHFLSLRALKQRAPEQLELHWQDRYAPRYG
jgi:hypothetical protein